MIGWFWLAENKKTLQLWLMSTGVTEGGERIWKGTSTARKSVATHRMYCQMKSPKIDIFKHTNSQYNNTIPTLPKVSFSGMHISYHDEDTITTNYCPMCVQFARNGVTVEQVTPLLHSIRRILAVIKGKDESMITCNDMMSPKTLIELSKVYDGNKKAPRKLTALPKEKFMWTDEFRQKANTAIRQLGIEKATPAQVVKLIQREFPKLTRQNMESYLQKIRMRIRRGEDLSQILQTNERSDETESSQENLYNGHQEIFQEISEFD